MVVVKITKRRGQKRIEMYDIIKEVWVQYNQ